MGNHRCVTIKPHWAWLIIHGPKRIENRSWPTNHRGRLLIHASKRLPSVKQYAALRAEYPELPERSELVCGAVIGSVNVVDCVPLARVRKDRFAIGPKCWKLSDPKPLARPVSMRGKLMLYYVSDAQLGV